MRYAAIVLLAVLAGCSGEPTAKDFEQFAANYAREWSGETTGSRGETQTIELQLISHDLRKTDSLTTPMIGTATYEVRMGGIRFVHWEIPEYVTTATYVNRATLTFGYQDGIWEPRHGEGVITSVELPELSDSERKLVRDGFSDTPHEITADDIQAGTIGQVNGWASMSIDEAKKVRATLSQR